MAQFWKASSVDITNGGVIVTVNTGDDVSTVRPDSFIQINTNQIAQVKIVNTSASPQTIELYEAWNAGTITGGTAIAVPTDEEVATAIDAVNQLIALYETVAGSTSETATASTIAQRDANGRLEAAAGDSGNDVLVVSQAVTSSSDTTADRLLRVGATQAQFSPEAKAAIDGARDGNIGLQVPSDYTGDVTDLVKSGFYRVSGVATNNPESLAGTLLAMPYNASVTLQQFISSSGARMFFHSTSDGGSWQELYHTGNTGVLGFANSVTAGSENINFATNEGLIRFNRLGTPALVQQFNSSGTVAGSINITSSNTVSFTTSSDNDLKTNFIKPDDALIESKMKDIYDCFTLFNWKNDPDGQKVWGFKAWDVVDKGLDFGTDREGSRDLPIGSVYEPATYDEDGNELTPEKRVTPAGVDQSKVTPYLVADSEKKSREIKHLKEVVETQQAVIDDILQRLSNAGIQ